MRVKIIAHRGFWKKADEMNSLAAFERALLNGYGVETDIRDYAGKLVISHNIASVNSIEFKRFIELYSQMESDEPLAINIKADGIQELLYEILKENKIENYFVFDMSVPEQIIYLKRGFKTFTRMSDFEPCPVLEEQSLGVWMDEWEQAWINLSAIKKYRQKKKLVSIISSEIHDRNNQKLWRQLKEVKYDEGIMLCTDIPDIASGYFNE